MSAPKNHTEMVLYDRFVYGSQFSGEKKIILNSILGCHDIKQKASLIFLVHPIQDCKGPYLTDQVHTEPYQTMKDSIRPYRTIQDLHKTKQDYTGL